MSDARTFVISDTHFGHRKVLEFEKDNRPYKYILEHDLDLVRKWNSVVRKKDTVWHLGDVYFAGGWTVLGSLNGYKRLVLGNHDVNHIEVLKHYFDRLYGVAEYGSAILSHIPVHPYQLEKRYSKNVHGHMHSKKLDDNRYICVSVEQTGCFPVLLQTAIQHGNLWL